ncbi:Late embryogenesis abundant protein [Quillaja saponaria]|uniref:Late embryogenesis abundant protein n=1 Tax=Quillaja saponaria TaxID=32244 RepID=A0AAD7KRC4_QUISA|nr:Late embryogenesis abundant protein [Quillaja saponaria]
MIHLIKTVRPYSPNLVSTSLLSAFGLRFRQVTKISSQPDSKHNMDKAQNQTPNEKPAGNVMSHSFGEGYATRSDEEGFGGTFSDNQSFPNKVDQDKLIHENHPAYDKTQGSEVKEKEKARCQSNASD